MFDSEGGGYFVSGDYSYINMLALLLCSLARLPYFASG
jgi:hypothetical protein